MGRTTKERVPADAAIAELLEEDTVGSRCKLTAARGILGALQGGAVQCALWVGSGLKHLQQLCDSLPIGKR